MNVIKYDLTITFLPECNSPNVFPWSRGGRRDGTNHLLVADARSAEATRVGGTVAASSTVLISSTVLFRSYSALRNQFHPRHTHFQTQPRCATGGPSTLLPKSINRTISAASQSGKIPS